MSSFTIKVEDAAEENVGGLKYASDETECEV
jgi:hypothetical protein